VYKHFEQKNLASHTLAPVLLPITESEIGCLSLSAIQCIIYSIQDLSRFRMIFFATFWLPKVATFGNPVTSQSQHFFGVSFYQPMYGHKKCVQLFSFLVAKVATLLPFVLRIFYKLFENYAHNFLRGPNVFESII